MFGTQCVVPSKQIGLWRNSYATNVYLEINWFDVLSENWFEFDLAPALPTSIRCFGLFILNAHICHMGSSQERESECGPCIDALYLNEVSRSIR